MDPISDATTEFYAMNLAHADQQPHIRPPGIPHPYASPIQGLAWADSLRVPERARRLCDITTDNPRYPPRQTAPELPQYRWHPN